MMLFKIAFRNIFRQKRRTILTALTMFGGFTLAAISIGWSDGSYSFIINMFTRNRLGHIQIHAKGYREHPSLYKTIDDYQVVGREISTIKGVEDWTPRLFSSGLVSVGDYSAAARLIGIDPQREAAATHFPQKITAGVYFSGNGAKEALIGKGLAKILHAKVGDEIVVLSQAADGSIANDLYHISGLVSTGDQISDRLSLYLTLIQAQDLLALQGRVHEIAVIAQKLDEVEALTRKIRNRLNNPDLDVEPWQVFAKSFYQAMKADQQGMWISLFVIILIVGVGVLNTVLMSVLERRREYGLLKAMGTNPNGIFNLVIYEVNIVAVASIIIGAMFGSLINYVLSRHGISLPQAFTYGGIEFQTLYSEVNARSLYIPALTVMISASLISLFPAYMAAKTEPATAMRMH